MEIHYLDCDGKKKLFSFHNYHFNQYIDENGKVYSIDGGFSEAVWEKNGKLKHGKISDLIEEIREQFEWISKYDAELNLLEKGTTKLLKDLTTKHIINILIYFTNTVNNKVASETFCKIHLIFLEELKYRKSKNIL